MAAYSPKELLRRWKLNELTADMTTGHVLQNLCNLQKAVDTINHTLAQMQEYIRDDSADDNNKDQLTSKRKQKPHR